MMNKSPEDRIWDASIEFVEATGQIIDKSKWEVRRGDFMAGYAAGYQVGTSIAIHALPNVSIKVHGELVESHTAVKSEEETINELINEVNMALFKALAPDRRGES